MTTTEPRRVWWSPQYRAWLRRLLVRLRGGRCQGCGRSGPLRRRVPPAVEVPQPTPDDARLLCPECCRRADAATANGPAVLAAKRRDRANGLLDRDAMHRWADDGGRI